MEDAPRLIEQYGPYLEEIRKRLYRVAVVFVAAFILGLSSTNVFLPYFVRLFSIPDVIIVATSPFQLLELAMSGGFLCALIFTIPFAFQQAYAFLRNGLLPRERRFLFLIIPVALALFFLGFAYGFAVMYYAIEIIAKINAGFGIANLWDITQFISQILVTSALLGVIFEFPLVLAALVRFEVFPIDFLRRNRRIAYATILIFVALLPPTDGLSFLVMSVPLLVMYELTILFSSHSKRKELL